jgi:hypothetical protein
MIDFISFGLGMLAASGIIFFGVFGKEIYRALNSKKVMQC